MKNFRHFIMFLSLIPLVSVLTLGALSCEGYWNLIVENQTKQTLTIYVERDSIGTVEPGQQLKRELPGISINYLIEAKNTQGETIFSKKLSRQQMQHEKGSDDFKVVITPVSDNQSVPDK